MINSDSLQKTSSTAVHSALVSLKQHEINADELNFKLALIQFFKNKNSFPCISNLLNYTPRISSDADETFIERYKYIFSDFYYLSSDADRLNQLTSWHSYDHPGLAALTGPGGFLNPNNSIDGWWSSSVSDYYVNTFALTSMKRDSLRYTKPEEKEISDDFQKIIGILTVGLKKFGLKMKNNKTLHESLKDACSQMDVVLDFSCLSDEIKAEFYSAIVNGHLT